MKLFKKVLKIVLIVFTFALLILYIVFVIFSAPKSDAAVLEKFENSLIKPTLSYQLYKGFEYRKLEIIKDTTLSTLVFVHGTIGSSLDFNKYMTDSVLLSKANMISYDRIGYNYKDKNSVQESIAFESEMLEKMLENKNPKKTILVGYSYGGPIVLATKKKYQKIILLAPAVASKDELMPWMLNFYTWRLTRWLVPAIWKEASKEKISHREDLQKFEDNWKQNPSEIISIHGNSDGIVPYANSLFLKKQFPKNQFSLITLNDVGHGLVWSRFKEIKSEIVKQLH